MLAPPYEPEGTLCARAHVVTAILIRAFKAGMEERVPIWTIITFHSALLGPYKFPSHARHGEAPGMITLAGRPPRLLRRSSATIPGLPR